MKAHQIIAAFVVTTFFSVGPLLGQSNKSPFTKVKGKNNYSSIDHSENIIDGRMNRTTIFNSSPLFKLSDPDHNAIYAHGSHVPVWINSPSHVIPDAAKIATSPIDVSSHCYGYLKKVKHLTKIENPSDEFNVKSVHRTAGEMHVKLQQKYKGVPVYGSEVIIHMTAKGTSLNGRYLPTPSQTNTSPSISESTAESSVLADLKANGHFRELTSYEKQLLGYKGMESELVLFDKDGNNQLQLAYRIEARPNPLDHWIYFINAVSGDIIQKQNHTCTVGPVVSTATDLNGVSKTFGTYLSGSTYYMIDASKPMFKSTLSSIPDNPVGAIWTIDANNTDLTTFNQVTSTAANTWDTKAVSAHTNADSAYNYYYNVHSRNSLDSNGGTIISVINVTDGGQPMENAYWNGKFMAYGNGDVLFKPLAGGLDVASHEMTHGVIQNTANLNYQGQSGAINESLADIFGCMVDREDWHIGEDIMASGSAPYFPTGYLRDLSNPHNGGTGTNDPSWQPAHMNEFVFTTSDNGGVHTNSGIPSYAYYLFATAVGQSKAEQVYYKALTTYLTASSQFIDLRLAIVQAATDLYPSDATIADAARSAFDQVGIMDGAGTTVDNDLPVNPGTDYILALGLSNDPNTIYKIDNTSTNIVPISTTPVGNKPSVTDDGSIAFFVDGSGNIVQKNMGNNAEVTYDNSREWDNVAVSRDGSKLAAVTTLTDSSIFVKPVTGGSWTRFKLYNPTFSTGITTSGPQYADALEWDYSGEHLVYDCYNQTTSGTDTIEYWNIGFINVWDNTTNNYGDGTIKNLFDGLPSYIDIGNPTFAKNSKNIIAFDLIDLSTYEVFVVGTNTENGNTNYIVDQNLGMLGFPTYSKNDDKVAFTSFNVNSDTAIFSIGLNADKISYSSYNTLSGIVTYGMVPVWYSTGVRVLGTKSPIQSTELKAYPNPFNDEISIQMDLKVSGNLSIRVFNLMGQPVKTLYNNSESSGLHDYKFSLEDLDVGTYLIKTETADLSGVIKVVKMK